MERAELKNRLLAEGLGEESGDAVFLCDPAWSAADRAAVEELKKTLPETGSSSPQSTISNPLSAISAGWLCVPTGGTSGRVRFARHDEHTLGAAVGGFCTHFGVSRVNAVGVLPRHHVSGLMAWARCAWTGGEYVAWDWKRLEAGDLPALGKAGVRGGADGEWFLSLVPTQLQRLLTVPRAVEWLRQFRAVFVGGGPAWADLLDRAAEARLRLALSYGMTETAAMVAAQRPEEFLAGDRSSGTAMPHASIALDGEGVVRIAGESVFRGYWPELRGAREFVTDDVAEIDALGRWQVRGRRDAVIITGGEKVQPAEVEAVLRASGEFADVAVLGVPDATWGQAVTAFYPRGERAPDFGRATAALAGYKRPKRFIAVAEWPRNAQGKVNRAALLAAAARSAGIDPRG